MTTGEKRLFEWQYGGTGHFFTYLFNAIAKADWENIEKLKKGYPDEVEAYLRYAHESMFWVNLQKAYRSHEIVDGVKIKQEEK